MAGERAYNRLQYIRRSMPASPVPRPVANARVVDIAAVILIVLLPAAILALNSRWLFGGLYRDPWIYYGFFRDAPAYIRAFHGQYYATRLSVILPGYAIHQLLSPVAAQVLLHLGLAWAALLSFYVAARETVGARAALLAALSLGGYPFFLHAVGWNHVDGFGLTYACLCLAAVTLAATRRHWPLLLAGAGAAAVALVSANLFFGVLVPLLALWYWSLNAARHRHPLLGSMAAAAAGGGALFLALGLLSVAAGGPLLYLVASLRWARKLSSGPNQFWNPITGWIGGATWLVIPAVCCLGALALLEQRRRTDPRQDPRRAQLLYLGAVSIFLLLQVTATVAALEYFYYATLLLPLAFFALAGQLNQLLGAVGPERPAGGSVNVSTRAFVVLAAVWFAVQLLPLAFRPRAPSRAHAVSRPAAAHGRSRGSRRPVASQSRHARHGRHPGLAHSLPAAGE